MFNVDKKIISKISDADLNSAPCGNLTPSDKVPEAVATT